MYIHRERTSISGAVTQGSMVVKRDSFWNMFLQLLLIEWRNFTQKWLSDKRSFGNYCQSQPWENALGECKHPAPWGSNEDSPRCCPATSNENFVTAIAGQEEFTQSSSVSDGHSSSRKAPGATSTCAVQRCSAAGSAWPTAPRGAGANPTYGRAPP